MNQPPNFTRAYYDAACERADQRMKEKNGHTFETILKTRCVYCGRSPKAPGKCRGWFMTFINLLYDELNPQEPHA